MHDFILKGGRVIDPSQNIDRVTDVAFAGGKVAAVGDNLAAGPQTKTRDVKGLVVTPGLIDLHTHVYWGGTSIGVDATELARTSATTTFVDAGTAGPANMLGFRKHVIEPSPVRILPYMNVSFPGIYAFSKSVMIGENVDMRLLDLREWVRVCNEHRDLVLGIKVRVGRGASGDSGISPLDMALEAATEVGLPVMAHLDFPPPTARDVLNRLRKGDVLTHCFRPFPNAPYIGNRVRDEVLEARARGVVFDIGHGAGSFGYKTTRHMLDAGFLPDVISSDVHSISIEGPAYDLLHCMSKFLCMGLDLPTVVKTATVAPALAISRPDLGTFKPGSAGDASLFTVEHGDFTYEDVVGVKFKGDKRLAAKGVVVNGRWWHP